MKTTMKKSLNVLKVIVILGGIVLWGMVSYRAAGDVSKVYNSTNANSVIDITGTGHCLAAGYAAGYAGV